MKNKGLLLSLIFISTPMITFASENRSFSLIKRVSQSILSAFSWIAIAIAFGVLFLIGVKYVTSSVNEKASLKNKFPIYMLGMILLASAGVTSRLLAKIAGNEDAETVVDKGIELSGIDTGHRDRKVTVDDGFLAANLNGHRVYAPEGVDIEGKAMQTNDGKYEITSVNAAPKYDRDGNEFLFWAVTDEDGNTVFKPEGKVETLSKHGKSKIKAIYSEGMTSFNVKDLDKIDKVDNDAKVYEPEGVSIEYHNKPNQSPQLVAPEYNAKNNKFQAWLVEAYDPKTGETKLMQTNNRKLSLPELENKDYSGIEYRCIPVYKNTY